MKNPYYKNIFCAEQTKDLKYFCTEQTGHTGDHAAKMLAGGNSTYGSPLHTWLNEAQQSNKNKLKYDGPICGKDTINSDGVVLACCLKHGHDGQHEAYGLSDTVPLLVWPNESKPKPVSKLKTDVNIKVYSETKLNPGESVIVELSYDAVKAIANIVGDAAYSKLTAEVYDKLKVL
jgi:hypothetical protein